MSAATTDDTDRQRKYHESLEAMGMEIAQRVAVRYPQNVRVVRVVVTQEHFKFLGDTSFLRPEEEGRPREQPWDESAQAATQQEQTVPVRHPDSFTQVRWDQVLQMFMDSLVNEIIQPALAKRADTIIYVGDRVRVERLLEDGKWQWAMNWYTKCCVYHSPATPTTA
jgi:hypothetical protein